MKKLRIGVLGVGMTALAAFALAGMPAASQGDLDTRLADFGVPAGAEIVAAQADGDGRFLTVVYRDQDGVVHTLGGVERLETPPPD